MEYRTVFDVAAAGYRTWHAPALGIVFVVAGAALIAGRKSPTPGWGKHPRAFAAFTFSFFGFAVLWTITVTYFTFSDYSSLAKAQANNKFQVVEGVVTEFRPMPVTGHAMERFCVSGKCFEYSDYVSAAGFNNTSSHGGPIHEGLQVRVSYIGNSILKLEIAK